MCASGVAQETVCVVERSLTQIYISVPFVLPRIGQVGASTFRGQVLYVLVK